MGLTIHRPQAAAPAGLVADRRLALTGDRARVVEDGDPEAAWLLAPPGTVIPSDEVTRLGLVLVDGKIIVQRRGTAPAPPPPGLKDGEKGADKETGKPSKGK